MIRAQHRRGEEPCASDRRRSSVMSISAVLNGSDGDPDKLLRINAHQTQQAASDTNNLLTRSRTNPSPQETPPYFSPPHTRSRAGSTSTQSSEGTTSRRSRRPKYSAEEEAFIWFHRVDLGQEWDTITHAFNQQFRHSHSRHKSGLECKLYRVLGAHRVPQIREWRKRGNQKVEEAITYYGIVEWTTIRYPWMGSRYWPPQQ